MLVRDAERLLRREGFDVEQSTSIIYAVHPREPEVRHRLAMHGLLEVSANEVWKLVERARSWR